MNARLSLVTRSGSQSGLPKSRISPDHHILKEFNDTSVKLIKLNQRVYEHLPLHKNMSKLTRVKIRYFLTRQSHLTVDKNTAKQEINYQMNSVIA